MGHQHEEDRNPKVDWNSRWILWELGYGETLFELRWNNTPGINRDFFDNKRYTDK